MDSPDLFPDDDRGGTTGAVVDPVGEGEDSKMGDATATGSGDNGGHEVGDDGGKPKRDRKRVFSYAEALEAKKAAKGNAVEACRQMMGILQQTTSDAGNVEDFEEYEKELNRLSSRLRWIDKQDRNRKFRNDPSVRETPFVKVADHPMYMTQPSQGKESSHETTGSRDDDFDPDEPMV